MKRAFCILFLAACHPSSSRPEGGDIVVPKASPDAKTEDSFDASAVPFGAAHGWYLDGEQAQPRYVDRAQVVAALRAGKKRAVAVIAEKIEECSSAGGTHVLLASGAETLHFGGHGTFLHVGFDKGALFVVAYDPVSPPESIEKSAFCVPDHLIHGRATALLQVKDQAEGEHLLERLAR
ncbi:MAG: hypothetical protein KIT84_06535 [Labilithrix sp.]|nr:hypothetical protein [Labilithrix sp.]MCW5810649.1 hypothetical protein [Labilithrix sp.]